MKEERDSEVKIPEKSTSRVRAFRQRQRANKPPKQTPTSAAKRMREYRARKKRKAAAAATPTTSTSVIPTPDKCAASRVPQRAERIRDPLRPPPKSAAQRMREHRARKKGLNIAVNAKVIKPTIVVAKEYDPLSYQAGAVNIKEEVPDECPTTNVALDECSTAFVDEFMKTKMFATTLHLAISLKHMDLLSLKKSPTGEICAARCAVRTGQIIIIVAVYISPDKLITDIIDFIHEELFSYTPEAAAVLRNDWGTMPMIMSGIFNVDFKKVDAEPLINFLRDKFQLEIDDNKVIFTARLGRTIDAMFGRNLNTLKSRTHVPYFSFHESRVSVFEIDQDPDE